MRIVFADSAYVRKNLPKFIQQALCFTIEYVQRVPETKGFGVLPMRWIVERTLAWMGRSRHNSKDYEHTPETSESMIQISMIQLMLRLLAPTNHELQDRL
ncbi:MAG: transposase [Planctomycetaceae bacterium]|nr:transposase [Planctomycetaceae bacterium]